MFLGVLHEIEPAESDNYNKAPENLKIFLLFLNFFVYFCP